MYYYIGMLLLYQLYVLTWYTVFHYNGLDVKTMYVILNSYPRNMCRYILITLSLLHCMHRSQSQMGVDYIYVRLACIALVSKCCFTLISAAPK